MKQIRKRLTYANVMSSIAVFLVLGGGAAFAAKHMLPKNSVGTKQLKKNSVNSAKVKNHSLRAADFKAGQLPTGPTGPTGPQGPKGDTGPIGPSDVFAATGSSSIPIGASLTTMVSLNLPAGHYEVIGRAALEGTEQVVRCNFSPAGLNRDTVETTVTSSENEATSFDVITLASAGTISYQCKRFGASATAFEPVLTAIKVGSITTQ